MKRDIEKVILDMEKTNKSAYQKLRFWHEEIKNYEQLSIKDAKKLNRMMLENSGDTRSEYRERLILGTLYLVYYFVCNSGYTAINATDFDIDDIMNTSIEIWINMLDNGVLINNNTKDFTHLFLKEFYVRINTKLLGKNRIKYFWHERSYEQLAGFNFGKILDKYIDCIKTSMIFDEKDCYDCIIECLKQVGMLENLSSKEIYQIYLVFYNITKNLNITDIGKVSTTNLDSLKVIFLDIALYVKNKEASDNGDLINDIDRKIILSRMRDFICNTDCLTDKQRKILIEKYGFNGDYKTDITLGKQLGISRAAVGQSLNRSFIKLRHLPLIRSIYFNCD